MKKIVFLLSVSLSFAAPLSAQHTIWLINKKKVTALEYSIKDQDIITYTNLKGKNRKIDIYKVFAITDSTGSEKLIYDSDSTGRRKYNVEQMRKLVYGFNDGYQNHKATWAYFGGILAGVPIPFTSIPYYAFIALMEPGIENFIIPEQYTGDEYYLLGYQRGAKRRIVTNSLIGSAITISTGPVVFVAGVIYLAIAGGYGM